MKHSSTIFKRKPVFRIGSLYISRFGLKVVFFISLTASVVIAVGILTALSVKVNLANSSAVNASPEPTVSTLDTTPIITLDDYVEYMHNIGVDLEFTDIAYDDNGPEISPNLAGYEATLSSEFLTFIIIVDTSDSSRIVSDMIVADISMINGERTDIIKIIEQITIQTVELLTGATFEEIDPLITDLIEQSAYAMNDTSGSINNADASSIEFRGFKILSNYYGSELGAAPYVFSIDLAPKNWTSYNVRKKKKRLTKELKEDGKKELHSRADLI